VKTIEMKMNVVASCQLALLDTDQVALLDEEGVLVQLINVGDWETEVRHALGEFAAGFLHGRMKKKPGRKPRKKKAAPLTSLDGGKGDGNEGKGNTPGAG
jgi:hypothetical protein